MILKFERPLLLDYPRVRTHSSGMDCLRGFLAVWVVFAHLAIWGGMANQQLWGSLLWLMKGLGGIFQPAGETHPAVVGFIVLSGYCIHRNGARRDRFDVLAYGIRRAFRIAPTYLLASVIGAVGFAYSSGLNMQMSQMMTGVMDIRWDGLLVKILGLSAFFPKLHYLGFQGNAPLTTVMVEIWLYVCYALAMRKLMRGMPEATLWKAILGIWAVSLAIVASRADYYSWWNNGSLIAFLPYWWLGAVAVGKMVGLPFLQRWKMMLLLYMLLSMLIASGALHDALLFLTAEVRKLVLAVLFANIIMSIDGMRGYFINWGAKLGQASYSIYAYHAPILVAALLSGLSWWLTPWLVVVAAAAIYVAFEAPLTTFGKNLAAKYS